MGVLPVPPQEILPTEMQGKDGGYEDRSPVEYAEARAAMIMA